MRVPRAGLEKAPLGDVITSDNEYQIPLCDLTARRNQRCVHTEIHGESGPDRYSS